MVKLVLPAPKVIRVPPVVSVRKVLLVRVVPLAIPVIPVQLDEPAHKGQQVLLELPGYRVIWAQPAQLVCLVRADRVAIVATQVLSAQRVSKVATALKAHAVILVRAVMMETRAQLGAQAQSDISDTKALLVWTDLLGEPVLLVPEDM